MQGEKGNIFSALSIKIIFSDNVPVNPATGQPDYSAQWAEYYRTMGMHEQANLIESQMKQQQQQVGVPQAAGRPQVYYNS